MVDELRSAMCVASSSQTLTKPLPTNFTSANELTSKQVVVDELRQCDVPCKLVSNVGELGEMLRAIDILVHEQPKNSA